METAASFASYDLGQTGDLLAGPAPPAATRKNMKSIARSSYRPLPSVEYMSKMAAQEADSIKQHTFSGAMGHRVLVDIKEPKPKAFGLGPNPEVDVFYRTSNSNFGVLASQIDPISGINVVTGKHTGILYQMPQGHGLNGRFTDKLAQAGMQASGALRTSLTKSNTLANSQAWGSSPYSTRNS